MKNSSRYIIHVDSELCIGCGNCQRDCSKSNISIENKKAVIRSQSCNKCGHCVAACPSGAISISGFSKPPMEMNGHDTLDPDAFLRAVTCRRSVRRFRTDPVPDEMIDNIIEAGRVSPTMRNKQDVTYIVLRDRIPAVQDLAVKRFRVFMPVAKIFVKGWRTYTVDDEFFFKKAPVVMIVCARKMADGHIAAANMELEAEACGLGVLYSGMFQILTRFSRRIRKELGLQRKQHIAAVLVMGYPAVTYYRSAQKADAEVRYL